MHRSALRLVQAAILAIGVSILPLATVSACSCVMQDLGEALASADVAIVGTVASVEPAGDADFGEAVRTTWTVASSRDAISTSSLAIHSIVDSGANCGISFGRSERWLVLAYRGDQGVLETNGCMLNRRLDGGDPEAEALVAEAMTPVTAESEVEDPALSIPLPIIGLGAAAVLIALISLIAFRRSSAS
jgi:hypothetical protein